MLYPIMPSRQRHPKSSRLGERREPTTVRALQRDDTISKPTKVGSSHDTWKEALQRERSWRCLGSSDNVTTVGNFCRCHHHVLGVLQNAHELIVLKAAVTVSIEVGQ
mmetsp:Transcript_23515/g.53507  ORF Transcript_23515/g.53507 Transcript_23515/m.53507 type:complete len:107 (+) Transcript_23515:207-527(+)